MYGSPVSSNESSVAMSHFYVQQRGFFHYETAQKKGTLHIDIQTSPAAAR
jgi:hypothetical protein